MCARLQLNFVSVPSIVASSSNPWCSALQAGTQLAISALLHSAWYSWTPLESAPPLPGAREGLAGAAKDEVERAGPAAVVAGRTGRQITASIGGVDPRPAGCWPNRANRLTCSTAAW